MLDARTNLTMFQKQLDEIGVQKLMMVLTKIAYYHTNDN
jgi:hypothetical protein